MAPQKITKNIDAVGEDSNPNVDILSNTTLWAIDTVKTWMQVFNIMEREIINSLEDSAEEENDT